MIRAIKHISFIPVWVVPGTPGTDPTTHDDGSGWLQPVGFDDFGPILHVADHIFTGLPDALDDVSIRFYGHGDYDAADEFLTVEMNEVNKGTVFGTTGFAGNVLSDETVVIPFADWNALKAAPVAPDPSDSIRIIATPETTVNLYPEDEDPNTACFGAPFSVCGIQIDISYSITEETGFQYGTGPAFQRWRSLEQIIAIDGSSEDYLWADMKWDNHLRAYQIVFDSRAKHYNGFIPGSAGEPVFNNPGNRATRAVVPVQYDPRIVRFSSAPLCQVQ